MYSCNHWWERVSPHLHQHSYQHMTSVFVLQEAKLVYWLKGLLGGFCSLLNRLDFWFATVMVFLEGTRVFISKDTSANQWLFGSTRAFRWDHFCFSNMHIIGSVFAVIIGAGISLTPTEFIGSEIVAGILKVTILAITSQLVAREHWGWFSIAVISLFVLAGLCGSLYGVYKITPHHNKFFEYSRARARTNFKFLGIFVGWISGTAAAALVTGFIITRMLKYFRAFWLKVIVASALVCLPVLQAKVMGSKYRYLSISIATALLTVNMADVWSEEETSENENNPSSNALLLRTRDLLSKILNTIMPILFFWGVMFPLPGISLQVSFYMLLSVIAAVLVGNLQIPVAFLQILLSSLRLHSLLAGHDYHPLPDGASPNLVPSILVFFVLELCQGSSNVLGVILGVISFHYRRLMVNVLRLTEEWGAKAVNLYYHQACMTIKEKGLFPMEKSMPPSLDSFAIESLGCTSSEMQIVRLHVLDHYLQQGDSKSKSKLIAQIANDSEGIVTKIAGTISHLITDEKINRDKVQQIRSSLSLSVKFVRLLTVAGGKVGTRFRKELLENPILLHNLQLILDLEDCQQELWGPAMDVIKRLALHDESTAKEIGSTHHAVICKLMGVFLGLGVTNLIDNTDGSLRQAAGEVLANLTITSSDNCSTILDLEAGPHDLIETLISMLQLQDDKYISVATKLLHNICANSGEMLINLGAKEALKSALQKVMRMITGDKDDKQKSKNSSGNKVVKQLHAALCVASQIGYVIPQDYADMLAENLAQNAGEEAEKLVGKLVNTLNSNREPNQEFPRLRRFLIGTVISIMESCPEYKEIFRKKGAEDALNKLKRTTSRLERYKVFIGGEGMVPESTPMHKLVAEAKAKLRPEMNPTKDAQASDRGNS